MPIQRRLPAPAPEDKLLPHDKIAEFASLGAVLENNDCLQTLFVNQVDAEWFYLQGSKLLWCRFLELDADSKPITFDSYKSRFGEEEFPLISDAAKHCEHWQMLNGPDGYLARLKEKWELRILISNSAQADALANNPRASHTEIAIISEKIIQSLSRISQNGQVEIDLPSSATGSEILARDFSHNDSIFGDYFIAKGQSVAFLGEGGLGKSRLIAQIAAYSVLNRDIFGFPTHGRDLKWLFIQTENTSRRLQRDIAGLARHMGADWDYVDAHLRWHTLDNDRDGYFNLNDQKHRDRLVRFIQHWKINVVVFDPLSAFGLGNLNSDDDMLATYDAIARIVFKGDPSRGLVILHHAGTGQAGAARAIGWDKSSFGRNSKALYNRVRAQGNIAPGNPDNADSLIIACGKNNNGDRFKTFEVNMDKTDFVYSRNDHFDVSEWQDSVTQPHSKSKRPPSDATLLRVAKCCQGSMTLKDLAKAVQEEFVCSVKYPYELIRHAKESGILHHDTIHKKFSIPIT